MRPALTATEDELVTEVEIADFLKLSTRTLQSWRINNDGPPFVRVGRAIRYRLRDVIRWIEARTVAPTAETKNRASA
ncbi:MAG TPA: helix-turn-helix domain-containing protein [Pseudolabrys sp.]|jgi:phage terminase Nu1 subunit (DNA packaging protein)